VIVGNENFHGGAVQTWLAVCNDMLSHQHNGIVRQMAPHRWPTGATVDEPTVDFLSMLREHMGKPLTLALSNALVHKDQAIQPCIKHLKKAGVTLYFLPLLSPAQLDKFLRRILMQ
jgi:hypothetical protein